MGVFVSNNKSVELTKGEEKVLDALKRMYSETENEIVIYVQAMLSSKRPDFIVIDSKNGVSILEVKDWSEDYIKEVNKRKVVLLDSQCDNPNIQVNGYRAILCSGIFSRDFDIDESEISTAVIFTNLPESITTNEKYRDLFKDDVKYLFKNDISKLTTDKIFNDECKGFSSEDLKKIRVALFPELEIVNCANDELEVVDIKALDYDQEEFARKIPYGHYMVTGIPGSGKTVILLARAIHLIKENPNWKILILTYNKSLSYKLKSKLDKMAENFKNDINNRDINIDNIEVRHFHEETSILLGRKRKPANIDTTTWFRETVVEEASIKAKPIYDAVLIDEYQDFYISWIELALKLCKEYEDKNHKIVKNLFLAGDRLQSIYNKNDISWSSIGIDMRGRSKLLKTSYRIAKQHMTLALNFLSQNKALKAEVDKFYKDDSNDDELYLINDGSVEFLIGNYNCIADKIVELKNNGYENKDILILADSGKSCRNIKNNISNPIKYQMECVKDIDSEDFNNNIILTTYHSSKGLEAKVVFLTNMDSIYNGDDAGEQLKRKTVYVGITRASEKLYIQSRVGESQEIVGELKKLMVENK